mmetsp:Transcript_4178/g.4586  ORF Transcript_4178/g.4586 Transcript_4178/m.4586 type:complete len:215 (-) Transcript_4178:99-743(-)
MTVKQTKVIPVTVDKGIESGATHVARGMAHERPGLRSGDINFTIRVKEHAVFMRKGLDLLVRKQITLAEALGGYSFNIQHLDGRTLKVEPPAGGKVVQPGEFKYIHGEGLPNNHGKRGNLHIEFSIEFPKGPFLSEQVVSQFANTVGMTYNKSAQANQGTPVACQDMPPGHRISVSDFLPKAKKENTGNTGKKKRRRARGPGPEDGQDVQCAQM